MSKFGLLYMKGKDVSASEEEGSLDNNEWDDRKLNAAYDKALKIANAEVARRIAMSTNTSTVKAEGCKTSKEKKEPKQKSKVTKKDNKWKVGMTCRAVYDQDGVEYEANIQTILNEEECVVKYIGYENSEVVNISSLRSSHGKEAQIAQMEQAILDGAEGSVDNALPDMDFDGHNKSVNTSLQGDDGAASPSSHTDRSFTKRTKFSKKKKKNQSSKQMNGFELPSNMPMPNLAMLMNGPGDMPLPPPPPLGFTSSHTVDSEDQAVSSMLLSWYMSGYYTGLYQGLKRGRENRRH